MQLTSLFTFSLLQKLERSFSECWNTTSVSTESKQTFSLSEKYCFAFLSRCPVWVKIKSISCNRYAILGFGQRYEHSRPLMRNVQTVSSIMSLYSAALSSLDQRVLISLHSLSTIYGSVTPREFRYDPAYNIFNSLLIFKGNVQDHHQGYAGFGPWLRAMYSGIWQVEIKGGNRGLRQIRLCSTRFQRTQVEYAGWSRQIPYGTPRCTRLYH